MVGEGVDPRTIATPCPALPPQLPARLVSAPARGAVCLSSPFPRPSAVGRGGAGQGRARARGSRAAILLFDLQEERAATASASNSRIILQFALLKWRYALALK